MDSAQSTGKKSKAAQKGSPGEADPIELLNSELDTVMESCKKVS